MLIEVLKVGMNFLIELFSGNLPSLYYIWFVVLFLIYFSLGLIINRFSTLKYKGWELIAGFSIGIVVHISLAKFLSIIVEDAIKSPSAISYYFLGLIMLTGSVIVETLYRWIRVKSKRPLVSFFILPFFIILLSIFYFSMKDISATASTSFIVTLSIVTTVLMMGLIILLEKEEAA
ncbi:hypothetical protein HPB58_21490 [Priestia filamentosa]|uniref:DUF5823 family protein n=1 Tax=Priestia filamentosa TaxID=1402861 RepID=UPI001FB1A7BE|nr:DUF5823 family protein [Priestia filamentosa]UOE59867.1 hypothetical protein HPB58_21490 [Priestia filamentosa]